MHSLTTVDLYHDMDAHGLFVMSTVQYASYNPLLDYQLQGGSGS
jgi:hypothetical protein